MAVHDGERYVAEAVDSVLGQSFGDLELVVVDDGSRDRSAEIVRAYADPRLRLLVNERNIGLAPSLNRGIAAARGEFVARLDADDVARPERLARQVAFMEAHPDVALVGSWHEEMAEDGTPGARVRVPTAHWDLRWHLHLYSPFAHSAVLWRRELVARVAGAYDEGLAYSMDYDLWWRISRRLFVANVPAYLVRLRTHASSMTSTYGDRTNEGLRMQAAHAARLLGWEDDEWANVDRVRRLYRMLIGAPLDRTQDELIEDTMDVVRLFDAFVRADDVPRPEAARMRREVRARLARQLLWVSRTAKARGRRGASFDLLHVVARLAPSAFASREAVDAGIGVAARVLRRP
jgi:glycosyltransferase involved in cell wall biosynthesis